MKATVRDTDTLRLLDPDHIRLYLASRRWSEPRPYGNAGAIYNFPESGSEYELLVPFRKDLRDFPQRISEILRTLEIVENRSQLEILSDITTTKSDVIRIRRPDARDGTLRLEDGAGLFQSAHDMLLSAACSAAMPKVYYRGKRPAQATDYIEKARLGQSERGSYVLTVISPITTRVEQTGLFEPLDPFERQVTRLVADGLNATVEASEYALSKADTTHFRESINNGISANFLDAVLGLMGAGHHTVDVNFAWSPEVAIPQELQEPITVDPDFFDIIQAASKELKELESFPQVQLVGVVETLKRPHAMTMGHITLSTFLEGRPRKVHIDLDAEIYDRAILAHQTKHLVSCAGELVPIGRTMILRNLTSFVVAPDLTTEEGPAGPLFDDEES